MHRSTGRRFWRRRQWVRPILPGFRLVLLPEPTVFAKSWKRQARFIPRMKPAIRSAKLAGWREAVRKLLS